MQKQTQKEVQGDVEIHRKITETERTEMEHKAKTTERMVEGNVEPSKPPFFTKKMQPSRAFEKERARFEVEFDGDPRPTIQWYREDFAITSSADFQVHTFGEKSILEIREVFMEDSGIFACVAENRGGRAKCSANLVVEERPQARTGKVPPSFTKTINDIKQKPGSPIRLDATVSGTQPIDIFWTKDGQTVNLDSKHKMLSENGIHTLMILESTPEDNGVYECVALNKAGEARCSAEVKLEGTSAPAKKPAAKNAKSAGNKAPKIVEKLKGQIVMEGQSAVFSCIVDAYPG